MTVGLFADAILRPRSHWWEWLAAVLAGVLTAPGPGAQSWWDFISVEVKYRLRRRLTWISVEVDGDALEFNVRGTRRVWCYDFSHRGRLDLAGRDEVLASRLARMAEALAAAGEHVHVALHVESRDDADALARTVLSLTVPAMPPPEWRRDPRVGVPLTLSTGRTAIVERRHYVRTPQHVTRTLRVAGFAAGREGAALEVLSERVSWLTLSLHASVVPAARARRVTSRAVHRVSSDAQLARGAGFRWSARREFELDALRQREQTVAAGAALCQWALYVVVRATSPAQLRQRVASTIEVAHTAGLRLDCGVATQREWFVYQLPGGQGW